VAVCCSSASATLVWASLSAWFLLCTGSLVELVGMVEKLTSPLRETAISASICRWAVAGMNQVAAAPVRLLLRRVEILSEAEMRQQERENIAAALHQTQGKMFSHPSETTP